MSEDELPDPLAAFDQALRAFVEMARAVRAYHAALIAEGFTEDQALELVLAWQKHVLDNA